MHKRCTHQYIIWNALGARYAPHDPHPTRRAPGSSFLCSPHGGRLRSPGECLQWGKSTLSRLHADFESHALPLICRMPTMWASVYCNSPGQLPAETFAVTVRSTEAYHWGQLAPARAAEGNVTGIQCAQVQSQKLTAAEQQFSMPAI